MSSRHFFWTDVVYLRCCVVFFQESFSMFLERHSADHKHADLEEEDQQFWLLTELSSVFEQRNRWTDDDETMSNTAWPCIPTLSHETSGVHASVSELAMSQCQGVRVWCLWCSNLWSKIRRNEALGVSALYAGGVLDPDRRRQSGHQDAVGFAPRSRERVLPGVPFHSTRWASNSPRSMNLLAGKLGFGSYIWLKRSLAEWELSRDSCF